MKTILVFALVLTAPLACRGPAPGQSYSSTGGFLRTTIDTYPESERRPILDYLDAARTLTDQAIIELASGNFDSVLSQIDVFSEKKGHDVELRRYLEQMRNAYGPATSYEFRSQAIEVSGASPDVHDLAHATSVVFYSMKTTNRSDGELFLAVRTIRVGNEQKVVNAQYHDYRGNVPPWLGQGSGTTQHP